MMSNRKKVTLAMLIATFLAAIEVTVVSTAIPRIASELGEIQHISWVFASYLLTSTVATPIFGKLADLFGRRRNFVWGAVIFLSGSMLSGTAQSMQQLIWFRAVQGIGAGAIMPTTFTIIGDIYPYEERAKVQGWISSVWGLSGLIGPLVGGFLVDYVSWRWIFYLNLPFGFVSVVMVLLFLKEEGKLQRIKIDYWGIITFSIAVTSLLYVLSAGGVVVPWNTPYLIGLMVLGAAGLVLFFWIETKVSEPMLPLHLFRVPAILMANMVGFLASSILIALNVYLPFWMQGVIGRGATESGLVLLPMSLGWLFGAIIGGRLMLKTGPRQTALYGMIFILAGTIILGKMDTDTPAWILPVVMLVSGLGFGFVMTVCTVIVQSMVGWNLRGVATASNTFLRSLGQTVGIAVFGTLFNHSMIEYVMAHPQEGKSVAIADVNRLLNPHHLSSVPEQLLNYMREALALSMQHIFIILTGIAIVAICLVSGLPRSKPEPAGTPSELERA
ncbi:MDR family MFS transporter [Thermoactinomyces mirandus]|uniref:MFS transporter n=1 Tax=Thermoactinomyces mirandus TaxID=2756294 RepID=A0A7W1XQC9_9BACL|nr:MDR family MFS transporter [Thermoactinomyces mirandus]MBA4601120.1 MFS transporter [Thermoactinomyces mirandus]